MKNLLHRLARKVTRRFGASWFTDGVDWTGSVTPTFSGVTVTAQVAMQVSTVYACVQTIAKTVAGLPLNIYRRSGQDFTRRDLAIDHPLFSILHDEPNPEQTAFEWREMMLGHLALRANAYNLIQRDAFGRPVALWPIHPATITPRRRVEDGIVVYDIQMLNRPMQTYQSFDILHLRALSDDGLMGVGPLQLCRNQIASAWSADEYAGRFFANDGRPSGILKTPNKIGTNNKQAKEIKDQIRQSWRESTTGGARHMIPVLDNDLSFQAVGLNPEDAQMMATREFNKADIAMVFSVPGTKIGLKADAKSSVEQENIQFATNCIHPWCERLEASFDRSLLLPADKPAHYIEFDLSGLLRGDLATQMSAFAIGLQWGIWSVNEVRQKLNLNPVDGGDVHNVPVNMQPIGSQAADGVNPGKSPTDAPALARTFPAFDSETATMGSVDLGTVRNILAMRNGGNHDHNDQ